MTQNHRRIGPHLAILAHRLDEPSAMADWMHGRRTALASTKEPMSSPRRRILLPGPPEIRISDASEARKWFGHTSQPTLFTWALQSQNGESLAVSAAAFPAIMMAERDARTIQEFADELMLHFVPGAGTDGLTWFADRDGLPAIFSPRSYDGRQCVLKAATVAVGLLAVATVAGYAVDADAAF